MKANTCIQILHTACPTKIYMLIHQLNPLRPEQNRALTKKDADSRVLRNSLTSLLPLPFKVCSERIIDFHFLCAYKILG